MGKTLEVLDAATTDWIRRQPMFFVATAPSNGGRVNLSPKGLAGSLQVLGPRRLAYLDLVGSGVETIAHLKENGRITLMFCAFEGSPRILRLSGTGRAEVAGSAEFRELARVFSESEAAARVLDARSVIVIDVERIAESCGFGVPVMALVHDRPNLAAWAEGKKRKAGTDALVRYVAENNSTSIDGLPGIDPATSRAAR